jgi:hypothetical protein
MVDLERGPKGEADSEASNSLGRDKKIASTRILIQHHKIKGSSCGTAPGQSGNSGVIGLGRCRILDMAFRERLLLGNSMNKPLVSAPEPSGWHHVHGA